MEEIDEPSGTGHTCAQDLDTPTQSTICRYECHLTGGVGSQGYEGVIATTRCMDNPDAVIGSLLDSGTSATLQDHDNLFAEAIRPSCSADLRDEHPGRPRSISPPSRRSRPNHVRRIDEKHYPSLAHQESTGIRCRHQAQEGQGQFVAPQVAAAV